MSERHKWAEYEMDNEEREWYNPRFGGNLKEFIRRMTDDEGFAIEALFPYHDGRSNCLLWSEEHDDGIQMHDYEEMAYEALAYEHSNMTFSKGDNSQTISVMMTGDNWCDVIPINDWSYRREQEDVVNKVVQSMRDEIMGDDA